MSKLKPMSLGYFIVVALLASSCVFPSSEKNSCDLDPPESVLVANVCKAKTVCIRGTVWAVSAGFALMKYQSMNFVFAATPAIQNGDRIKLCGTLSEVLENTNRGAYEGAVTNATISEVESAISHSAAEPTITESPVKQLADTPESHNVPSSKMGPDLSRALQILSDVGAVEALTDTYTIRGDGNIYFIAVRGKSKLTEVGLMLDIGGLNDTKKAVALTLVFCRLIIKSDDDLAELKSCLEYMKDLDTTVRSTIINDFTISGGQEDAITYVMAKR